MPLGALFSGAAQCFVELIERDCPIGIFVDAVDEEVALGFGPERGIDQLDLVLQRRVAGDELIDTQGIVR
ncbi:hypothetical protein D3C75_1327580 [compost metagenome]